MGSAAQSTDKSRARRKTIGLAVQLAGAILAISSVFVAAFSSQVGATTLSTGTVTVRIPSSGAVADSPLSEQEVVEVEVAPNAVLKRTSLETAGYQSGAVPIRVEECADSGGTVGNLPTKASSCDPTTLESVGVIQPDGSLVLKTFTVLMVPDVQLLGPSTGIQCDASHECVLGIFSDQNDFQKPHLFSAPFLIDQSTTPASATSSSGSTANGTNSGSTATVASASASPVLANTGSPTLWPWLLGSGAALIIVGTLMRLGLRRA